MSFLKVYMVCSLTGDDCLIKFVCQIYLSGDNVYTESETTCVCVGGCVPVTLYEYKESKNNCNWLLCYMHFRRHAYA